MTDIANADLVEVCDNCYTEQCWKGGPCVCEKYKTAGTVLIRKSDAKKNFLLREGL